MAGSAGGYDIQASNSRADNFTAPQTTNAGTVFNFSSPGSSGDWYNTPVNTTSSASSSAASGKAGTTAASQADAGAVTDYTKPILIGAGLLALALIAAVIAYKKL